MSQSANVPCAADFMTRRVRTVTPEMSVADVVAFLLKHKISNVPVVEAKKSSVLVGFISERDCLAALSHECLQGCPCPETAGAMMNSDPICVSPDAELFSLASEFVSHGYRHLPVAKDGMLVGIVSRRDVLAAMCRHMKQVTADRDVIAHPPDCTKIENIRFAGSQ